MDIKEAISHIPELVKQLKEKFAEKVQEQKFTDAKLKDGTLVSYDGEMPIAGTPFFVIDTTGQRLPAPDGEYLFEDGSAVMVTNGTISEVKPVTETAEPEAMAEGEANESTGPTQGVSEADVTRIVKTIIEETVFSNQEYVQKFEALEKENADLKESLEKTSSLLKETFSIVEKIASQPIEEPKKKKDGFMVYSEDERAAQIKEFREKYLKQS